MDLNRFIADLKRRRVFRVAVAYVIVGWACIQIADSTFPHLGLPEWMIRTVIITVALGFPVALGLAWAFDITPTGVRRTDGSGNTERRESSADRRTESPERRLATDRRVLEQTSMLGGRGAALIGLGVIIALVGFGAYAFLKPTIQPAVSGKLDSVAVLPFVDLSAAKDQEYFSDGISEELLNALSKVEGLRVPGRTSSFQFKDKNVDIRTIGSKLGVSTVLEGSVQKVGKQVRINAQLTDATSGDILWSAKYDKQLTDIFVVQDEITRSIVDALKMHLTGRPGAESPVAAATSSSDAHDAYLVGLYKLNRRTLPLLRDAAVELRKAIAADPKYAPAYAALADVYLLLPQYGASWSPAQTDSARNYALEALKLDPNSAEAHAAYGAVLGHLDWKFADAERELKRAIELNPNYATAHQWYGELSMILDRRADAVRELRRAVEIEPLSPLLHSLLGMMTNFSGDAARAEPEIRQALRIDSTYQRSYRDLTNFYLLHDRFEEAAATSARASRIVGTQNDSAVYVTLRGFREDQAKRHSLIRLLNQREKTVPSGLESDFGNQYAFLGDYDAAFDRWNKAVDKRATGAVYIRATTAGNPIHNDPRFALLMKRIGLE